MSTSLDGKGAVESLVFMGKTIGFKCLASILGIGKSRLKRGFDSSPDLRFGKPKNESHKDTMSIDAFLALQYENVAETLPDRRAIRC